MSKAKTYIADVYTEGKTQIIKLPRSFHIDDGKVTLCRSTEHPNVIEIMPKKKMTTREFLESTPALGDDFVITRDNKPLREVDCMEFTPKQKTLKEFLKSHTRCTDDFFHLKDQTPLRYRIILDGKIYFRY